MYSRVSQTIEDFNVKSLDSEELRTVPRMVRWTSTRSFGDAQIESDAKNLKLRSLAERAVRDHQSGRSSLL